MGGGYTFSRDIQVIQAYRASLDFDVNDEFEKRPFIGSEFGPLWRTIMQWNAWFSWFMDCTWHSKSSLRKPKLKFFLKFWDSKLKFYLSWCLANRLNAARYKCDHYDNNRLLQSSEIIHRTTSTHLTTSHPLNHSKYRSNRHRITLNHLELSSKSFWIISKHRCNHSTSFFSYHRITVRITRKCRSKHFALGIIRIINQIIVLPNFWRGGEKRGGGNAENDNSSSPPPNTWKNPIK